MMCGRRIRIEMIGQTDAALFQIEQRFEEFDR